MLTLSYPQNKLLFIKNNNVKRLVLYSETFLPKYYHCHHKSLYLVLVFRQNNLSESEVQEEDEPLVNPTSRLVIIPKYKLI